MELIVVVGLIVLLLSFAAGVMGRVKARSQAVGCAANLRSLGIAFSLYAEENRQWIPRAGAFASQRYPVWPAALLKHLGVNRRIEWADLPRVKSLQCPSHPTDGIPTGYVSNSVRVQSAPFWSPAHLTDLSAIKHRSSLPLLLEAADLFSEADNFGPFNGIFFEDRHTVYSPSHLPGGAMQRVTESRHAGRVSNVLFADWHVSALSPGFLSVERLDSGIRVP